MHYIISNSLQDIKISLFIKDPLILKLTHINKVISKQKAST